MQLPILIAADIDTIIRIAIVLLFVIGPAILKLFGGKTTQADRTPPPNKPQAPQRPRPQQAGNDLESEIAQFLQQAGRGDNRSQPPIQEAPPSYASEEAMVRAEMVAPLPPITAHDQLPSQHVKTEQEELPSHGEHYTDSVEAYLRAAQEGPKEPEAYDYDLGGMDDEGNELKTTSAAAELAAMFRNPSDIRKVIVLNEIMNRPNRF
ncbi:hypothetical protein LOC68_17560 [Blastopirellula sp. JC732]|uniref:Uncharacterized protein n=1 Tax=Blastopirellula sediminis TaxID=2894196 RepID=A0A9X1SGH4_9BACT|nr:hypothetical protein [Blastopirellula sediminis]MCC9606497.1 hypothetical protein [Blastopirellula sediminis]MCC9630205.1 hypothetical protein [Blastopirellula sediminis]